MLSGAIAVFASGAAVMVAELVAARLTAPYYGQSNATWGALVAVTLLGVTIGNYGGGILAQKSRRPLRVAATAALGGSALLAVLPAVLPFLASLAGADDCGMLLFVAMAFLPVTALLGMISPSVGAACVRPSSNGRDLGILYFASMTGSMLGSAAAGLYLPFVMTTGNVCRLSAAVLAAVGAMLFPLAGSAGKGGAAAGRIAPPVKTLVHVFAVGFAAMASELALARFVTPVLGGSHIVWSAIFITFIGMMGVGGFIGGKLADRFAKRLPVYVLYGVLAAALYLTVLGETRLLGTWTLGLSAVMRLVVTVFAGFAPYALVLGFVCAFLMQKATYEALQHGDRSSIGLVYAVNGIGSSFGSLFAGMFFVSSASVLAALPGASRPLPAEISLDRDCRVVYRGESSYNSVTVTTKASDRRFATIWLDRVPHTTVDLANPEVLLSSYTRLLDAAVDTFAERDGLNVFVIGGGGYALPRKWCTDRKSFSGVDVAEIDPLVSRCAHRYMDAPEDSAVMHDFVADGRRLADEFIRDGKTNSFDFVIGDTIGDAAIPYHLATREFFEKIRDRLLVRDGVYLMHVLDTFDDPGLLSSIIKTLGSVFPNVVACSYAGVRDVRQSFVVAASSRKLDVAKMSSAVTCRWPEALPIAVDEDAAGRLAEDSRAVLLEDGFAPVEKFVWRTMTRDVQYRSYALANEMSALAASGDFKSAFEVAKRVLEMQPEETRALGIVADEAVSGNADAAGLLAEQASRPSVREEAKVRYALYLANAGRKTEAVELWREIVRRWPDNKNYAAALEDLAK